MFEDARPSAIDEMPPVLVAAVNVLHKDYGCTLEDRLDKALTVALYWEWLACGESQAAFAKRHKMSLAKFKRKLDELLGEQRAELNRDIVRRRLAALMYRRLQVAKDGMSFHELKDALAKSAEVRAAKNHKVDRREVLAQLERQHFVTFDQETQRFFATGPKNEKVDLPTRARRLEENAHNASLYLEAARVREQNISTDDRDSTCEVTRFEFFMKDCPEERRAFYDQMCAAILQVINRFEERVQPHDAVRQAHVPTAVLHRLQNATAEATAPSAKKEVKR